MDTVDYCSYATNRRRKALKVSKNPMQIGGFYNFDILPTNSKGRQKEV